MKSSSYAVCNSATLVLQLLLSFLLLLLLLLR
jgi:hypothetical protein